MTDLASVQLIISGRVQGVNFRDFASGQARELGLTGYVRNLPDGKRVEVQAEGERSQLERLTTYLKAGPPRAIVGKIATNWSEYRGSYPNFSIRY